MNAFSCVPPCGLQSKCPLSLHALGLENLWQPALELQNVLSAGVKSESGARRLRAFLDFLTQPIILDLTHNEL